MTTAPTDTVTLREYFERLIDERDRQYHQRFEAGETAVSAALAAQEKATATALAAQEKAVAAALTAQDKATQQAFDSSEKAIGKAEDAQTKHNAISNEFRGQLADQAKTFLPRLESDSKFASVNAQIAALQKVIEAGASKSSGFTGGWGAALAIFGLVALALAIASRFIQ